MMNGGMAGPSVPIITLAGIQSLTDLLLELLLLPTPLPGAANHLQQGGLLSHLHPSERAAAASANPPPAMLLEALRTTQSFADGIEVKDGYKDVNPVGMMSQQGGSNLRRYLLANEPGLFRGDRLSWNDAPGGLHQQGFFDPQVPMQQHPGEYNSLFGGMSQQQLQQPFSNGIIDDVDIHFDQEDSSKMQQVSNHSVVNSRVVENHGMIGGHPPPPPAAAMVHAGMPPQMEQQPQVHHPMPQPPQMEQQWTAAPFEAVASPVVPAYPPMQMQPTHQQQAEPVVEVKNETVPPVQETFPLIQQEQSVAAVPHGSIAQDNQAKEASKAVKLPPETNLDPVELEPIVRLAKLSKEDELLAQKSVRQFMKLQKGEKIPKKKEDGNTQKDSLQKSRKSSVDSPRKSKSSEDIFSPRKSSKEDKNKLAQKHPKKDKPLSNNHHKPSHDSNKRGIFDSNDKNHKTSSEKGGGSKKGLFGDSNDSPIKKRRRIHQSYVESDEDESMQQESSSMDEDSKPASPLKTKKSKSKVKKELDKEANMSVEDLMDSNTYQRFSRTVDFILDAMEDVDLSALAGDDDGGLEPESLIPLKQLQDLSTEAAKLKRLKAMSQFPIERLIRLLTILDRNVADGSNLSPVALEMDLDDDGESSRLWVELATERVTRSADACLASLYVMTSPGMPEKVFLEELIEKVVMFLKFQLQNTVFPAFDPAYRGLEAKGGNNKQNNQKRSAQQSKMVKKDKATMHLYNKLREALGLMAELVELQGLTDTIILQVSTLGVSPFFVEGVSEMQLHALRLVTAVFFRYDKHRQLILEDILTSIARLPTSKRSLRNYRLSSEENIQMLTALVLQLIHSVVKLPEPANQQDKEGGGIGSNKEDGLVYVDKEVLITTSYEGAVQTAASFLTVFLRKCGAKHEEMDYRPLFENLVQDLLSTVNKPEWPAAEVLLSVLGRILVQNFSNKGSEMTLRVASLDYLGVVAARLRKDAISSRGRKDAIDDVVKRIVKGEKEQDESSSKKKKKHQRKANRLDETQMLQRALLRYIDANAEGDPCLQFARRFYIAQWYHDAAAEIKRSDKSLSFSSTPKEEEQEKKPSVEEEDDDRSRRRSKGGRKSSLGDEGRRKSESPRKKLSVDSDDDEETDKTRKKKVDKKKSSKLDSDDEDDFKSPKSKKGGKSGKKKSSRFDSDDDEDEVKGKKGKGKSSSDEEEEKPKALDSEEVSVRVLALAEERKRFLLTVIKEGKIVSSTLKGSEEEEEHIDYDTAELISQYLASGRPFSKSFDLYLSQILRVLNETAVAVRTKAMKCLASVVEADPSVLSRPDMQKGVHARLLDQSTSVREAAVDLLGKSILARPGLTAQYYEMLTERILDTGVSVRKRVIKILKDICLEQPDFPKTSEICVKMIRRINDEDGIKKLVGEVFQSMWFTPAPERVLLVRVENITRVVEACRDTGLEWFEQLLSNLLKSKDGNKEEDAAYRSVLKSCKQIVDCLVENILQLEESAQNGATPRLVACLSTLHLFSKIHAPLVVPHATTIQPYLSMKGVSPADLSLLKSAAQTLEIVVPLIEHPGESFLAQIEEDVVKLILRQQHSPQLLASCVSCLGAVVNKVTHNHQLVQDCFKKFFHVLSLCRAEHERLNSDAANDNRLRALRPRLIYSLFTVGLFCRHFDFDSMEKESSDLKDKVFRTLLYFLDHLDPAVRLKALSGLGSMLIRHYDLMLGPEVKALYHHLLTSPVASPLLKKQVLKNITTYLVEEELRMIRKDAEWAKTSKKEDLKEMGDVTSGMASTVIQVYLKQVLGCVLHEDIGVRKAALQVIQLILSQGLVHPVQLVPYLVCLGSDDDPVLRTKADQFLQDIEKKYPGFIQMKAMFGVRMSFQMQEVIQKNSVEGILRGFRMTAASPISRNGFLYTVMRSTRQNRRAFLLCLLKLFDEQARTPLEELLYIADNVAYFPYAAQDEPLFVMHQLDIMLSVSGSNLLQTFRESLITIGEVAVEEDEEESEEALLQRLPEDVSCLRECIVASQGCVLLLYLKQTLKEMYGFTDHKVQQYSPNEAARVYERPLNRKGQVRFNPETVLEFMKEEQGQMEEEEERRRIVQQYAHFKQLMLTIDPTDEDDEDQPAASVAGVTAVPMTPSSERPAGEGGAMTTPKVAPLVPTSRGSSHVKKSRTSHHVKKPTKPQKKPHKKKKRKRILESGSEDSGSEWDST